MDCPALVDDDRPPRRDGGTVRHPTIGSETRPNPSVPRVVGSCADQPARPTNLSPADRGSSRLLRTASAATRRPSHRLGPCRTLPAWESGLSARTEFAPPVMAHPRPSRIAGPGQARSKGVGITGLGSADASRRTTAGISAWRRARTACTRSPQTPGVRSDTGLPRNRNNDAIQAGCENQAGLIVSPIFEWRARRQHAFGDHRGWHGQGRGTSRAPHPRSTPPPCLPKAAAPRQPPGLPSGHEATARTMNLDSPLARTRRGDYHSRFRRPRPGPPGRVRAVQQSGP